LKSLKSRKGALKRKEKLVKGEMDRFQGSLARLNAVGASTRNDDEALIVETSLTPRVDGEAKLPRPNTTSSRWAALRGFISSTMEQNPAFLGNKEGGR
jgi:hypothetical protein